MKKIVSLVMAIVMVALMLPVGVLAAGEEVTFDGTLYFDGTKLKTVDLNNELPESFDETITGWESLNTAVATVSDSGVVTAVAAGTAKIRALYKKTIGEEEINTYEEFTITVKARSITAIELVKANASKVFYVGDDIAKSDFKVTATYDNGDTRVLDADEYNLTPVGQFSANSVKLTATLVANKSIKDELELPDIATPNVKSVTIKSISDVSFKEGDKLPSFSVEVKYNNNDTHLISSGFDIYLNDVLIDNPGTYTFKVEDNGKSFKVSVNGIKSGASTSITVTPKSTETEAPSTSTYTITCDATGLVKKEYKVGETFDPSGIKVFAQKNGGAKIQKNYSVKTGTATVFSSTTQTTASVTILVNVESNKYEEFVLEVSGLTVKAASVTLDPYSITSIKMDSDGYAIGHNFDVSDINYIYYKAEQSSSRTQLFASAFANYSDEFTLEVRKTNGSAKTSKKTIIEEANVYTADDDDDVKLVNLRFSIGSEYIDFTVEVIEPKVSYYYDDDLVAVYDSLATALNYTEEQDPEIEEYYFDLSDVDDDEHILLVLGADASMSSSSAKFDVKHNIEIDLNGHDLTFRSTTVDDFDDEDYTVTIKNTAEEEATFTYYDKDIDIILEEDDEFVFEKGYDEEDYLPGVVVVSLDVPTTGTVTANRTITNKKIAVGMGNEVKLTITPKSGYAIDTVLLGGKSVTSSSDYKLTSTGATYTFKPKENVIVKVTFKETASDWDNPFTDVSSNAKYYTAVAFVCENNLFKGVSSTKFSPNGTMTRAMFATVLARLADVDVSRYTTSSFTDVSSSDLRLTEEMVQSIEWACRMGLVEGYGDGTFGPHNEITHQQMYLIMYRYTLYVENKSANVSSVRLTVADKDDVADWALTGVKFAEKNELLVASSSNKITPKAAAVRSELAMLLEKYCNNVLGWADEE